MVLCNVRWNNAKDCSYGDRKNYTDVLGVFMRVETEKMYLYPLSDEEMRMVMRLLVDHGLRVMDITKAVSLRLRIIKLRLQYNLKMQAFERTKIWLQAKNIYNLY